VTRVAVVRGVCNGCDVAASETRPAVTSKTQERQAMIDRLDFDMRGI
jgi:hypothetical protein